MLSKRAFSFDFESRLAGHFLLMWKFAIKKSKLTWNLQLIWNDRTEIKNFKKV